MELTDVWFVAIAALWVGYFFLEGFDFGVGVLLPVLGRTDTERRVLLNTIGPVWDGNETWLIVAGGAMFAAFPEWYATVFSGFYLPLLVVLVALIVRGVAFEYRGKGETARWRRNWDRCVFWGSLVPAVMWGVVFGNIVRGVRLDAGHEYVGSVVDLFNPYALLGGVVTLGAFVLHGAVFLTLKTTGAVRARAREVAAGVGGVAVVAAGGFLLWTQASFGGGVVSGGVAAVAAVALVGALVANRSGREGFAFVLSGVTVVAFTVSLFATLYPTLLPSTLDPAGTLTATNAAATPYTLRIMSWVALVFLPLALAYQGYTYWVFRRRIGTRDIPPAPTAAPVAAAASPTAPDRGFHGKTVDRTPFERRFSRENRSGSARDRPAGDTPGEGAGDVDGGGAR